jgi:hypothetical protein
MNTYLFPPFPTYAVIATNALTTGNWNNEILLIILDIFYPTKEKRIWMQKL